MKCLSLLLFAVVLSACMRMDARDATVTERPRILVSTDIGGTDPDDNQSMIHLLMYANEFDIEGLVSSPSFGEGSKEEIFRMISLYEQDRPSLVKGLRNSFGDSHGTYPSPEYLTSIVKQGHKGSAPLCGYDGSTEGSEWIVKCARRADQRPLWILVWGALEDVAQALHDAPDISEKIRIYWIGGPNKKWGCNAYNYIVENFPSLWFIENNATYRGFIGSTSDTSIYQKGFWPTFMEHAGAMGDDFVNYYGGMVKMGDTPSLLYLMKGDPERPSSDHWGGRFEVMNSTPRYIITGPLSASDTVPCYSLLEWRLNGPQIELAPDSVCFSLTIDRQNWPGYYAGDGIYVVRYAPKAPATLGYTVNSDIVGFPNHEGTFTVGKKWPTIGDYSSGNPNIVANHIPLGKVDEDGRYMSTWFTDIQDYSSAWQGSPTISGCRNDIMKDWSLRFQWLK